MPEEKKKNSQMVCGCGMGMCGCGPHGHCWLRLVRGIFAVVILAIVFMFGVKIGELRGVLENGRGYRMMSGQPYAGYGIYPMMGGQGAALKTATSSVQ